MLATGDANPLCSAHVLVPEHPARLDVGGGAFKSARNSTLPPFSKIELQLGDGALDFLLHLGDVQVAPDSARAVASADQTSKKVTVN
jgi:hypothetical protein